MPMPGLGDGDEELAWRSRPCRLDVLLVRIAPATASTVLLGRPLASVVAASTMTRCEFIDHPKKATSARSIVGIRAARSKYLFPRSQDVSGQK